MSDVLRVLAVLALVAGNAFFVIVISTVQVGITAIGILTGAVGEPVVRDLLGDGVPAWLGFAIAFGAVTYLSVVFGELVPKALTLDRAERLAVVVAPPIEMIARVLKPVVWVLDASASLLLRPFGVREVVAGEGVRTAAELRTLVDEAEVSGVIPRSQEELLHNVFDFAAREAGDVMVPEPDVAWLDADLQPEAALEQVVGQPYSRYPVGRGSLDRLVGVIHVRDLVAAARGEPAGPIGSHAEPAPVVPATKDLGALLRELREQRRHLAIVADEYGGTAGIVTLEIAGRLRHRVPRVAIVVLTSYTDASLVHSAMDAGAAAYPCGERIADGRRALGAPLDHLALNQWRTCRSIEATAPCKAAMRRASAASGRR